MDWVDLRDGDGRNALRPEAARPFPVAWLSAGLIAIALLIAAASILTFIAKSRLRAVAGAETGAVFHDVNAYLTAAMGIRFVVLSLVVAGIVIVRRGARRLDLARAAAEDCAVQLREQKRELHELNKRLFNEARIDSLTKLHTRLKLSEDLAELWADAERYGDPYCAVMCDVDRFKEFNDRHGHVAGDEVLRSVARVLIEGCRAGDRVYRYGGEEFLLILRVASTAEAATVAERHRAAVEALAIRHGASEAGIVTVSMGVAPLWSGRYRHPEAWIEQADAALYRAKRSGRNRIVAIDDEGRVKSAA